MGLISSVRQLWVYLIWGNATSIKILFGTAGLQRWSVETVEEVFKIVKDRGVNDLDAAHIYVRLRSLDFISNANILVNSTVKV